MYKLGFLVDKKKVIIIIITKIIKKKLKYIHVPIIKKTHYLVKRFLKSLRVCYYCYFYDRVVIKNARSAKKISHILSNLSRYCYFISPWLESKWFFFLKYNCNNKHEPLCLRSQGGN